MGQVVDHVQAGCETFAIERREKIAGDDLRIAAHFTDAHISQKYSNRPCAR